MNTKPRFFPEDYRAFANGPLSVCMERFGGVESVRMLDIRTFEGRKFPARRAFDLFSRNGKIKGLANANFMSAAIYFENQRSDGTHFRYAPEYPEIHPSGVRSGSMNMRLKPDSVCFRLTDSKPGVMRILASKLHYYYMQGTFHTNYNQNTDYHESWLTDDLRGTDYDPNIPFPNRDMTLTKKPPVFMEEKNAFVFEMELDLQEYRKTVYAVLTSQFKLDFQELANQWVFTHAHDGKAGLTASIGFGETVDSALAAARNAELNDLRYWEEDTSEKRFPRMAKLSSSALPEMEDFVKKFPCYQAAAILFNDEFECCNRAAQDKFGYFVLWDQIFPLRDYLVMGEPEWCKRSLRQAVTYPHVASSVLTSMQTVPAAAEYLAFTGDLEFIRELMPYFQKFFDFALGFCHPETGLLKNTMACAVDFPAELGIDGLFYEAGLNGWWYDFCRSLQNMALSLEIEDLAERCGKLADKIQAHYLDFFYDEEENFLIGMLPEEKTPAFIPLTIYTSTLGLEYVHGSALLRRRLPELADFQVRKLHHPMGLTAVPLDSPVPAIAMKAYHMNQHLNHECVCARLGGHPEEALHVMSNYLCAFNFHKNAIETFNYCWCAGGGQSQYADWQTFSATGAMQALIHSILGLGWHRGGLFYMPAEDKSEVSISNFYFRGKKCTMHFSGSGKYVDFMTLNGVRIENCCQLPADIFSESPECVWELVRTEREPERPVLLWAADLPLHELKNTVRGIEFTAGDSSFANMEIYSPRAVLASVNGVEVKAEDCGQNIHLISRLFRKGDHVIIGKIS